MNNATANTSAIDHFAIISTNFSVRVRLVSLFIDTANATSAAFVNGTMTLNSRINVAGRGLPTLYSCRTELTMRLKARARLGEDLQQARKKKVVLSPEESARLEQIKHLPFGTWFEFQVGDKGEKVRRRLSWFSTVTGHVLFVNHRGQKIGEHTLEGLAKAMAQGEVKVVEEEKGTLIDRAWATVMNALRSFAGQAPSEATAR